MNEEYRLERDFLGEKKVPARALWGIHTQRALENFKFSRYTLPPRLIKALAIVKKACCLANFQLGYLPEDIASAIVRACDEIIEGKHMEHFPLDPFQGGAGTSTNMNLNEVIANRATEILGGKPGDYIVHPIEHVNLHQSTNDVYPTAVKVAVTEALRELQSAIAELQGAFQEKEKEFAPIVKSGRTELQPAVPFTLGKEFSAFADAIARDRWRTFKCEERIRVVNLGGTAIGTGMGAPRSYIFLAIEKLRELTGFGLARAENLVDATANVDPFVEVSGILKAHASNLLKICNDLRLLNMLGEIKLPQLQVGSSIMPGKINPVMMEAAMQVAMRVMANDSLISDAASRGTFQICEFMPLIAFSILESLELLINLNLKLAEHVRGIEANPERCHYYLSENPEIITALLPIIGYERASELLKEFKRSDERDLKNFLERKLGKDIVDEALSPENVTALGYRD